MKLAGYNVQTNNYWSSTAYNGSNAWNVNFNDGNINYDNTGNDNYVWPAVDSDSIT